MENKKESASTPIKKVKSNMESGRMEKELTGQKRMSMIDRKIKCKRQKGNDQCNKHIL